MKKALLSTFLSLALAALLAPAAGAQTPPTAGQASGVTVIQNATILTVTQGTIENGSILIRNGKIARVGRRVRRKSETDRHEHAYEQATEPNPVRSDISQPRAPRRRHVWLR